MQTFVPYDNLIEIVTCLDRARLGKQRVECKQILQALEPDSTSRWRSHPAVKMWRGCENLLKHYANLCIIEWMRRGYNNNMPLWDFKGPLIAPFWWGGKIHATHRSNLLRKFPEHYNQFGWSEGPHMDYYWPGRDD